jgi:hypothetical protein
MNNFEDYMEKFKPYEELKAEVKKIGECKTQNDKEDFKTLSDALFYQIGGTHYQKLNLQPAQMCEQNFTPEEMEGAMKWLINKYIWRNKGGIDGRIEDMRKIIQYAQMYIGFLNSVKTKGGDDANL